MHENSNEELKTAHVFSETAEQRFLSFVLNKGPYAIPLLQVKEVIGICDITPIPQTPNYFKGIMNLRGQVIPVIDLRLKLKLAKAENGPETSIIILDLAPLSLGIVVDTVESVLALSNKEISTGEETQLSVEQKFLSGVAKKDKKLILLLDVRSTLSIEDINQLKKQTQKQAA